MQKQIFYTYKFKSSRLAEFNYDIQDLTFEEAKENKEVISMFDSQLLRSIRFVKGEEVDYQLLDKLKHELEKLKKQEHSKENSSKIIETQRKIDNILFVPEVISIVIENKSHYRYLFKNKLSLNGKIFRRFSSSAGQARSSTVLYCETEMADKLDEIFDNGRDKSKKLVPSKFNAYKGLITSSTSVVSTPRFCLVPDYESETEVKVNFVTEKDLNEDDEIEVKTITELFNRFDGQGIISIEKARQWADELGLDYVPAQWCIRQNYIKGMLSTFDIKAFCREINNGDYMIKTSYKDENGEPKLANLLNTDVIISESQFKLWDSFPSLEVYQENCEKNQLQWGVSLISPKKDKDILKMNYQFLQTLRLEGNIEKVCSKFVDWISGVTSKDIHYTLLFLLGTEIDEDKITSYIENSDNHWVKALMLDHNLIHDKWIKRKIYDLVKKKIKNGCLGQILVEGNFQVIVSDPFAMMQHVCGLEVTGLLGKKEYYSNYWNKKGVKTVDSMRAPLTYRSEHVVLDLKQNEELDKWYKYNNTGIIVNVHGHETMNWAGSDFDMDIIATTSDESIIKGVYRDELPIAYIPPKSDKTKLTERKLYNADIHSFGSEIGQITNKSTSGYALLAELDETSEEYTTTMNRIKMCTKLQSAQIDKAKIGRKVKSIPKIWMNYNKIDEVGDSEKIKQQKESLNKTLLDKHPYFFTYLYKGTKRRYKNYYNNQDATCRQLFGVGIEDLKKLNRKTPEQLDFINTFNKYSPVINSNCVMNKICRYIESIDFGIRNIVKQDEEVVYYKSLMSNPSLSIDEKKYSKVKKSYQDFKAHSSSLASTTSNSLSAKNDIDDEIEANVEIVYDNLNESLLKVCSNIDELVDYLIHMFYIEKTESNKDLLWKLYGEYIVENIKSKINKITLPIPCKNGEYTYLDTKYTLKEVSLINE